MTASVFFSFHYDRDNWRVQQIKNLGIVEGQPVLEGQDWEEVKRGGQEGIKKWIGSQMAGKKAVVVLAGAKTAERPWVQYEIRKAWQDKIPLVGIRIHGMKGSDGQTDTFGADPFAQIPTQGGGTLANYLTLYNPSGSTSTDVFASISSNIESWVNSAYKRS
ncbi:TIR domain-containing protein [Leifsonia sp. NPDC102414]|uniref:TIR domain-containing protein n=1 Tax=Leifsonia sp. NPDC102414 TaxID=3364124 RepID=UPI003804E1B0